MNRARISEIADEALNDWFSNATGERQVIEQAILLALREALDGEPSESAIEEGAKELRSAGADGPDEILKSDATVCWRAMSEILLRELTAEERG